MGKKKKKKKQVQDKTGQKRKLARSGARRIEAENRLDSQYLVYTDGGCSLNPGGRGGYGVVIIDCETGEISELSGGYLSSTNNRMEIMAAIEGLKALPEGVTVTLFSDSQYLLNTMDGQWQKKKNLDLWEILQNEQEKRSISLCWVRGHTGDIYNERCDHLATAAMSGELIEDAGYVPERDSGPPRTSSSKKKTGSMGVDISIPERTTLFFDKSSTTRTAKEACLAGINAVNSKRSPLAFKDFKVLKTGGLDDWSQVQLADLVDMCGRDIEECVRTHLKEEADVISCLKWYARGLRIDFAIRKVLVDAEIRKNANRKSPHTQGGTMGRLSECPGAELSPRERG